MVIDVGTWRCTRGTAPWDVIFRTAPYADLKELGGWKSLEMIKRYAHLAPEHLAQYAGAVMFWSGANEEAAQKAAKISLSY